MGSGHHAGLPRTLSLLSKMTICDFTLRCVVPSGTVPVPKSSHKLFSTSRVFDYFEPDTLAMNTVYGLFALCALVARCAAAPNCDGSAVLPCLYPTIAYAISPEGQQLTQVKDSSMITEPQLKGVCR